MPKPPSAPPPPPSSPSHRPLAHSLDVVQSCPEARRQAPLPLHAFATLHAGVVHSSGTFAHVPSVPPVSAAEHAWHVPVHAEEQQTLFAQKVDSHWFAIEQAAPVARRLTASWASCAPVDESGVDESAPEST